MTMNVLCRVVAVARAGRYALLLLPAVAVGFVFTSAPAWAGNGYETVTSTFGSEGSGPGQLKEPTGVAVNDETEDVYVLDSGNDRIEYFTSTGTYLGQFNGSGEYEQTVGGVLKKETGAAAPTGKFLKPGGIAVDSNPASSSFGDVYVADTGAGHEVVDKFSAAGQYEGQLTGTCTEPEKVPPACEEGGTFVPFVGLKNVTVDAAGDVWVYEGNGPLEGNGKVSTQVDELSDTGSAMEMRALVAGGDETPGGESEFPGFALDSSGDVFVAAAKVYEFGGGDRNAVTSDASGLTALAVISANNDLLVDQGSSIELFNSPIGAGAQPLLTFPATGLSESEGIAVNGAKGDGTIYATQRGSDDVDVLDSEPAKAPEIVSESASTIGGVEEPVEQFAAVIAPGNRTTTYTFEYASSEAAVLNGEGEQISGATTIPAGFGDQAVVSPAVELRHLTTTYYRVVAENEASEGTPTVGNVEPYTKLPLLADEKVFDLTSTSAILEATINPIFQPTKYAFEYSTSKALLEEGKGTVIEGATGFYQQQKASELQKLEERLTKEEKEREEQGLPSLERVPICPGLVEQGGTGELPEVNKPCPVNAEIYSLEPGQTYYWRVAAKNEVTKEVNNINKGKPVVGEIIKELTPYAAPGVLTGEAQNITSTAATLSGEVNPEGTEATYHFAYINEAGYNRALKNGAANPASPNYQEELADGAASPYAEGETTATLSVAASASPQGVGPIPADGLRPGETYDYALVAVNKFELQTVGPNHRFTTEPATPQAVNEPEPPITVTLPYLLSVPVTPIGLPITSAALGSEPHTTGLPLTLKQKLEKALKACRKDKKKSKRQKCEHTARSKYKVPAKKGHAQK
jgi:hypothetical protein